MKKTKLFAALGLALSLSVAGAGLAACSLSPETDRYEITIDQTLPIRLAVGDEVDFTAYFHVTDKNGNTITVTEDMLDLTEVNLSSPGVFTVWLELSGERSPVTFYVFPDDVDPDKPTDDPDNPTVDPDKPTDELSAVFAKYEDMSKWNFAVDYKEELDGDSFEDHYEYFGYNILYAYEDEYGDCTDYLAYDPATDSYTYYWDLGDGDYEAVSEDDEYFDELYYNMYLIDPYILADYEFTANGSKYSAKDPVAVGNAFIGEFSSEEDDTSYTWVSFDVSISGGRISKIVAVMDDGYTVTFTFSKYGAVNFTLPNGQGGSGTNDPVDPPVVDPADPNMMEKQTYNKSTFDDERLQDKIPQADDSIGLPSIGSYHALVVPVQFSDDTFTTQELADLNTAFNGTEAQTGWESVSTYYTKCSNNQLNLTFDIQSAFTASRNSSYYERQTDSDGYSNGDAIILKEVLQKLDSTVDFSKYDFNKDGMIDAVYLIYSVPVDYDNGGFYWAFTTWYMNEETYDGRGAYYYFFAGIDFIYEKTAKDKGSGEDMIDGLKINAETFIHETGHLLGLDDYYDTDPQKGSNEGVGGADMMDFNIGDHDVYSKIMLGWLDATVVNSTQTITIQASAAAASQTPSVLLIPLDFDNSYFSEYLLIDLYSATGLNELHAGLQDTYLYGGKDCGVRIYHVSSSIENHYSANDYYSFTDCNNSVTANALIKLIEADGDKNFETNKIRQSSGGDCAIAEADDLWQAGDVFSKKFPAYTRNDGKTVNFDIEIKNVSSASATITITFKN